MKNVRLCEYTEKLKNEFGNVVFEAFLVLGPIRLEIKRALRGSSEFSIKLFFGHLTKGFPRRKTPNRRIINFRGGPGSTPNVTLDVSAASEEATMLDLFHSFLNIAGRQKDYRIQRFR